MNRFRIAVLLLTVLVFGGPAALSAQLCNGEPPSFLAESDVKNARPLQRLAFTGELERSDRGETERTVHESCEDVFYYDLFLIEHVADGEWLGFTMEADFAPLIVFYRRHDTGLGVLWEQNGSMRPTGFRSATVEGIESSRAGPLLVAITSQSPRQTGRYHFCWRLRASATETYPCSRPETTSSVEGLTVGGSFFGTYHASDEHDGYHESSGYSVRVGLGIDPFLLFGEYHDEIATTEVDDEELYYSITGYDGGVRYLFGSEYGTMRPYLQATLGLRERESVDGDLLFKGYAFGGGIGTEIFLGRSIAFDASVTATRTNYDEVTLEEEVDWTPLEESVAWTTYRLSFGASLYLSPLFE